MYDLWKPTFDKLLARIRNNVTSDFYEKFSYSSISLRGAKYKNLIDRRCIYTNATEIKDAMWKYCKQK